MIFTFFLIFFGGFFAGVLYTLTVVDKPCNVRRVRR